MAEAVLSFVGVILEKILPLAADEISRAWGVEEELQELAEKLKMARALICDATTKPSTSKALQLWLTKLQSLARRAEIVLDDYGYEVLREKVEDRKRDKVRKIFSPSNPVLFRLKMAGKIKDVRKSLEETYKEAGQIGLRPVDLSTMTSPVLKEDRLTHPFVEESEIVGRQYEVSQVVSMLINSDYKKDLPVISIVGMGGQGKTTLAQMVLKNDSVVKYFDNDCLVWVCVSDDFKVGRLLNEMLQSLGINNAGMTNTEPLVKKLQDKLKGKRYLLVLDDVWNDDPERWDRMRSCLLATKGAEGSKILATTRSHEVASAMQASGSHQLEVLSDDHSWMLFEKIAFVDGGATKTQDLVDVGRRILKKCGGLPLAIKLIGGLLRSEKNESDWLMIEKSEIWTQPTNILPVLKLSYESLPSSVKQCFASCSIFPKDTIMEKENLIQIWMAQGLINNADGRQLQTEDRGSEYLNILLQHSLLQATSKDSIIEIKMHDLVHDLSFQVSNNCFCIGGEMVPKSKDGVMHLTIFGSQGIMLKNIERILPNLQTLYFAGDDDVMLKDILKTSRHLCVLIVKCWSATQLPNAVGNLRHLRYLDTSETQVSTLPYSITKLYYLMTLRVRYLVGMPVEFGNLINLRHFQFSWGAMGNKILFPRIGQLANLQTLPHFCVSKDERCQLEELEHLHNLQGKLRIFGLENVSSFESAEKANLSKKSSIQSLKLSWVDTEEDFNDDISISVMDGLRPHPNLKKLVIRHFKGSRFPSWMVTMDHLTQLRNLVSIKLRELDKCEEMPPLGVLPCLESLEMFFLPNVKRFGAEFYGLEHLDNPSSSCSREVKPITLFPKLSRLKLRFMESLEEWSDAMAPSDSSSIKAFPNLQDLRINTLSKLAVLPNMENLTRLTELSISRCGSLACIGKLNSLTSLESLCIKRCPQLDVSLDMKNPQSLKKLTISKCDKLNPSLSNNLEKFTSLESLKIDFHDPSSWAKGLHHLANLRSLCLGNYWSDPNLDYFPWPDANSTKQHFNALEELRLYGWPKITSLPNQIQHLSTLRSLEICKFDGMEALPEWIGNLRNLRELWIRECSDLKQLPPAEAMQHLTNLKDVCISDCPLLAERYRGGSGPGKEWPKIAHISLIIV